MELSAAEHCKLIIKIGAFKADRLSRAFKAERE